LREQFIVNREFRLGGSVGAVHMWAALLGPSNLQDVGLEDDLLVQNEPVGGVLLRLEFDEPEVLVRVDPCRHDRVLILADPIVALVLVHDFN